MQPDHFIFIGRIVQRRFPFEIFTDNRQCGDTDLPTDILDISCIDITISIFVSRLGREFEELVTGIRLIIRPAKTDTVV